MPRYEHTSISVYNKTSGEFKGIGRIVFYFYVILNSMSTEIDPQSIERFRRAIRIDTSWPAGEEGDEVIFSDKDPSDHNPVKLKPETQRALSTLTEFQNFLVAAYPVFHRVTERTVLNPFCALYRWPGKQTGAPDTLPVLFLAHYDVVPVDRELWTTDPFGAEILDDYIYGRGTLDTKSTLICAMEAAEALASKGFVPEQDIWFVFGGDEERSGAKGAQKAAAFFRERNINFSWLLDEGSIVALNQIPGVEHPLALIGVEEKGFLDIELLVRQTPGHASRPPEHQAAADLAEALIRLSKHPFPYRLIPSVEGFFTSLSPLVNRTPFQNNLQSLVLGNPRRLGSLFFRLAGSSPATRALLRTTLAMTQLFGAKADNILPSEVRAILNLRLLPGDTVESALTYVQKTIGMDSVIVRPSPYRGANNPVTADQETAAGRGPGWQNLTKALSETFPAAVPIPFLVTATTDSRHYADLCRAVYRFGPMELEPEEVDRIHGHDERISLDNLKKGIAFYLRLMEQL